MSKLTNKKIVCIGDSLMYGSGWIGGYANCIKENHPEADIENIAISGTTLVNDSIFSQIIGYYKQGKQAPDLIIFDGGGNDFINRATLGEVAEVTCAVNDSSTTCGALENMINAIRNTYPKAKLLYISTPPMYQWGDGTIVPGIPTAKVQREYLDAIEKVLDKWSVAIADIHRNGNVTSYTVNQTKEFFMENDTIHFNENGYRHVAPVIEDALNKLF